MTTEQKAKAYDEALEKAKKLQKTCDSQAVVGWCEHIFPELKESEDERIRKDIVFYIAANHKDDGEKARWLYWLEKQKTSEEAIQYLKENHSPSEISDFQAAMNIAVAKAYDKGIKDGIRKQGEHLENYDEAEKEKADFVGDGFIECHANFLDFKEGNTYWLEYIGDDKYNVRSDNLLGKTYHITPCQLYTIFKKQTWLEKQGQEPKKVEDKPENYKQQVMSEITDLVKDYVNQKPTEWSEKDESHCQMIQKIICNSSASASLANKLSDWLTSLKLQKTVEAEKKELKKIEQKSEWSEDDEKMRKALISVLKSDFEYDTTIHDIRVGNIITWLKSLKNRAQPQLKQE